LTGLAGKLYSEKAEFVRLPLRTKLGVEEETPSSPEHNGQKPELIAAPACLLLLDPPNIPKNQEDEEDDDEGGVLTFKYVFGSSAGGTGIEDSILRSPIKSQTDSFLLFATEDSEDCTILFVSTPSGATDLINSTTTTSAIYDKIYTESKSCVQYNDSAPENAAESRIPCIALALSAELRQAAAGADASITPCKIVTIARNTSGGRGLNQYYDRKKQKSEM